MGFVSTVTIGIDVGQRVDPTAIAVCQLEGDYFTVHYLERLPLGTAYPAVAKRVRVLFERTAKKVALELSQPMLLALPDALEEAGRRIWTFIDITGVGSPVCELLREGMGAEHITGVSFTYGDRCGVYPGSREGSLGKGFLVSRLQVLLQSRRIALPETSEARALAEELLDYEIRVTDDANARYGAFKVGTHDDLVTALGLATLFDADAYTIPVAYTVPR